MRVRMVTTTMSEGKVLLGVRGVSKSFFQVEVPAGIDLQIHRGELLVLSGPNGAGKTTLLKMMAGLLRPDLGEVVHALVPRQRAFVPDEALLQSNLTVWENMMYAAMVHDVPREEFHRKAAGLLRRYGIWDKREAFPGSLSYGMGRKAALCAVFVTEPLLLLADEPFSGLDEQSLEHLVEDVVAICVRGGAVVVSTHRFDPVAGRARRVLCIEEGTLTEAAPA